MSLFTPSQEISAQTLIKGSRFIAHLIPLAEWERRLAGLGEEHRKASHICTATREVAPDNSINDRARDDGEPGGTAGRPMLAVLVGANIVDAGVAVVRYFGGTKLGTGGLARAYGGAAAEAVAVARLVEWHRIATRRLRAGFSDASTLEQLVAALPLTVTDRLYDETGTALIVEGPEAALNNPALAAFIDSKKP